MFLTKVHVHPLYSPGTLSYIPIHPELDLCVVMTSETIVEKHAPKRCTVLHTNGFL